MFFVLNKQKIISYIVVFSTVIILFCGANIFVPNMDETIQTTASNETRLLPIYSVRDRRKENFSYNKLRLVATPNGIENKEPIFPSFKG